jgi:hypothetical protein
LANDKVEVIVTDESGKEIPFFTKTLTAEFKNKPAGKKYKIFIQEPGKEKIACGEYAIPGTVTPPPPPPPPPPPVHTCPTGQHWDEAQQKCVDDDVTPPPPPPPPTGEVLYDSHRDSKLHDGQVRTIAKSEGAVTPNGLGIEMHASGNPRVQVNNDGTFSLLGDGGFPRFYGYVVNYDSTLEIECAFWNDGGQDLSLKVRSRHNEGGACENRFGGYGLAVDRAGWDAKREVCHNVHDESQSGKLPTNPKTKEYFTIKFTVKDQGNEVRQIGEINGQPFMNKVDSSPKPYMVDKASFDKQSYFWVRSNNSGHTEVRIKSLRVLKAF